MSDNHNALEFVRGEITRRIDRMKIYQDFLTKTALIDWLSTDLLPELDQLQDEVDHAERIKDETDSLERDRDDLERERDELRATKERDTLEKERDELKQKLSKKKPGKQASPPVENQSSRNSPLRLVYSHGLALS